MKKHKGLTLVEMLVAMGLMSVMIVVSATGYRSYNQRKTVQEAARRVRQIMNQAKANATSVRIDCTVCGNDGTGPATDIFCDGLHDRVFQGWRVRFSLMAPGWSYGGKYSWYGECGGQVFSSSGETLPANVMLNVNTGAVFFRPFGAGTDLAGNMVIQVRWKTDNTTIETVTVTPDGLVQ